MQPLRFTTLLASGVALLCPASARATHTRATPQPTVADRLWAEDVAWLQAGGRARPRIFHVDLGVLSARLMRSGTGAGAEATITMPLPDASSGFAPSRIRSWVRSHVARIPSSRRIAP